MSGADCDRLVPVDAPHCGDPSHVSSGLHDKSKLEPSFVSNRQRPKRPTLTVNEDFEMFEELDRRDGHDRDEDVSYPDLSFRTFDASTLLVGTDAQKAFTGHHQVTPEVAISEIRLLADKALQRSGYRRYASGFHRLEAEKYMLRVSPDGSIVTRYATRHYERLPSEVFAGKPSRFGGKKAPYREPGPPKPLDELSMSFDPMNTDVLPRAVSAFAKREGLNKKIPATEAALRLTLAGSAESGTWSHGHSERTYLLSGSEWVWLVAADYGTVITAWRHDDPPKDP